MPRGNPSKLKKKTEWAHNTISYLSQAYPSSTRTVTYAPVRISKYIRCLHAADHVRSPSKKRWRTASCKDATRETGNIIFARLCYTSAEAPFKTARHRVSVQRNNAAKGQLRRRPLRCRPAVSPGSASSTTIFFFTLVQRKLALTLAALPSLYPL